MENASKALIIAGAILLSILIISLGIMVYQNAKNTVGNANLNKQEIETFNSQWETYEGTSKTASEVKTMIRAVIASNASEEKAGTNRFVFVTNTGSEDSTPVTSYDDQKIKDTKIVDTITNNQTYTIKVAYSKGLVVSLDYKEE